MRERKKTCKIITTSLSILSLFSFLFLFVFSSSAITIQSRNKGTFRSNPSVVAISSVQTSDVSPNTNANIRYRVGSYGPDDARRTYRSGRMVLIIPRIGFEATVLDSMTAEEYAGAQPINGMSNQTLDFGIVLFNQSQLPGYGNGNVSIAGHRDVAGMEFYYLDRLQEGDLLYIVYRGKQYTYRYKESVVTDAYAWHMVSVKDTPILTLQTCEPIGVSSHRLFVVADLIDVSDVSPQSLQKLEEKYPSIVW